jgi:esterase
MSLFYRKIGNGPPLVVLHGLFGSGDNWQTHAKVWAEKFTVYLIDQRNHGHAPHSEVMNYTAMCEDLVSFFAEEGLRDVALLGHSMGGKTAMHFALDHSFLLEKLIVVDMGIKAYPSHHDRIFEGLFFVDVDHVKARGEAEDRLRPFVDDPATLAFLMKNMYWKENQQLAWRFNLPVLFRSMPEILAALPLGKKVDIPTLFIRGERSNYILDEDREGIENVFSDASFQTVAEAGHWPHAENPKAFQTIVQRFLE